MPCKGVSAGFSIMDVGAGGADCFIVFCGHKIQRVFDNLLHNAVLYSYTDTEIAITAEVICFRNHGDTIPEEKLARIFEQFYRLDAARSSSGGVGLGLAIAQQIVELHGGAIEARSTKDMIEFTVKLPLS